MGSRLASYNYFPQMIAGEKKFDRLEIVEQLFQAAIVEELRAGFCAACPRAESRIWR